MANLLLHSIWVQTLLTLLVLSELCAHVSLNLLAHRLGRCSLAKKP